MTTTESGKVRGPEWARGCDQCNYGLIAAPEPIGALSLYEQRAIQAHDDMLDFCNCRAGHMYRQHLRKVYNNTSQDARDKIRNYIWASMPMPTIHLAEEPTP